MITPRYRGPRSDFGSHRGAVTIRFDRNRGRGQRPLSKDCYHMPGRSRTTPSHRLGIVTATESRGSADRTACGMPRLSYRRHGFPPPIIPPAIWRYLRFTLSYRDVEELPAERGPRHFLRDGTALGAEIRSADRGTAAGAAATPERSVAPGRDGRSHRGRPPGQAAVAAASFPTRRLLFGPAPCLTAPA